MEYLRKMQEAALTEKQPEKKALTYQMNFTGELSNESESTGKSSTQEVWKYHSSS